MQVRKNVRGIRETILLPLLNFDCMEADWFYFTFAQLPHVEKTYTEFLPLQEQENKAGQETFFQNNSHIFIETKQSPTQTKHATQ